MVSPSISKYPTSRFQGINILSGPVDNAADMREHFVIDPLIGKRQQLLLATQLCRMVLKVNNVIIAGSDENEFFESEEDIEAEFHGQTLLEMRQLQNVTSLHLFEGRSLIHLLSLNRCRRR